MIFSPPNLPQTPFDVRPQAYGTPGIGDGLPQNQPFVWGAGGARLTPEQLLAEQEMARDRMKSDYSPVSSVWQGLGRVADNWLGALDARRLDKEQAATTERSNSVLQGLMNSPDQGSLISAASDPYLNSGARDVAALLLKNSLPKRKEYDDFQNRLIEGGILPGTQEWIDANRGAAMNTSDPIINATVGGRDFFGPRSLLQSEIGKGGDPQISPSPGPVGSAAPASAGPGVPHLTVDQMRSIGQGVNFAQWQQREQLPVLVTSPEEMASVPVGTMVISLDGRRGVKK